MTCGWHVDDMWMTWGWHEDEMRIGSRWHVDNMLMTIWFHVDSMWMTCEWYVDEVWITCRWHVDYTWITPKWHMDYKWVTYGWHVWMTCGSHMVGIAQDALSIVKCRGLSYFLVHSEPCGGHYTEQNLLWNISFFQSWVLGSFYVKKTCKVCPKKTKNTGVFLSKIKVVKKWTQNDEILRVKRFLLSFPQYLSLGIEILHRG